METQTRIIVNLSHHSLNDEIVLLDGWANPDQQPSKNDNINKETCKNVSKELYKLYPQTNISVNVVNWSSFTQCKFYVDNDEHISIDSDESEKIKTFVDALLVGSKINLKRESKCLN